MKQRVTHPSLFAFCAHLEHLASATSLPEWSDDADNLEITGLGDPLPGDLDGDGELLALVNAAREVSASQFWTKWKPEEVHRFLAECASRAGLDPELVLKNSTQLQVADLHGWGRAVSQHDIAMWALDV